MTIITMRKHKKTVLSVGLFIIQQKSIRIKFYFVEKIWPQIYNHSIICNIVYKLGNFEIKVFYVINVESLRHQRVIHQIEINKFRF